MIIPIKARALAISTFAVITAFVISSILAFAVDGEKLARQVSSPSYNHGNLQDVYWDPGTPPKTTFVDTKNGGVLVVRGTLTTKLPIITTPNGDTLIYNDGYIETDAIGNMLCQYTFDDPECPWRPKISNGLTDSYNIEIFTGNNLQIRSNLDVVCDVYDLNGNAVITDFAISGNKTTTVDNLPNINQSLFVIIKLNGQIIRSKTIIVNEDEFYQSVE